MKKTLAVILTLSLLLCVTAAALAVSNVYFSGNTNVRSGPGTDYGKLGSVNAGSTLPYTGGTATDSRGVTWYCVIFNGSEAWVSSRYSSLTSGTGSATYSGGADTGTYDNGGVYGDSNGGTVYANSDVNVRSGPGTGYAVLGTLKAGQSAESGGGVFLDTRGIEWYEIWFHGNRAWVSSTYTWFDMNTTDY